MVLKIQSFRMTCFLFVIQIYHLTKAPWKCYASLLPFLSLIGQFLPRVIWQRLRVTSGIGNGELDDNEIKMKSVQFCDWSRLNVSYMRLLLLLLINTFIVFFVSKALINLMKHTHTQSKEVCLLWILLPQDYVIFNKSKHLTRKKLKQ